ncbi:MAG: hypothetical protein KY467_03035 [Gemmatimonadetes bacterium]|nr:hypothetical protein [Gemmatimonadota bacterium]
MEYQYAPNIVSMDGFSDAVAASVSLSLEEQQQYSASSSSSFEPTMGYFPVEP